MSEYRFVLADTPELRRLPFERMEAEGMTRPVLWHRARPCLVDWLEGVNPLNAVLYLAYGGEVWPGRRGSIRWWAARASCISPSSKMPGRTGAGWGARR